MDTVINTQVAITLRPVFHSDDPPKVQVDWGDEILWEGILNETVTMNFTLEGKYGYEYGLGVTLLNKKPGDTVVVNGEIVNDKAVSIDNITVEGFALDSIMQQIRCNHWCRYPDGSPAAAIDPMFGNYVCYNERWHLPIRLPAFTWIHKLERLGWIYGDTI
jgi:hypothetical protein